MPSLLAFPVRRLLHVPVVLYTLVVLVIFLSGADMALGRLELFPLPPTLGAVVFLAPLCLLAVGSDLLKKPAGLMLIYVLRKNSPAFAAFLLVVIVSLLFSGHPTAYWEEAGKWIFIIGYGFLIFCAASLLPFLTWFRRSLRSFLFVALLALMGSMITDVISPGFFSTEVARAAGFPGNANLSSIILVLLCASMLHYELERHAVFDLTVFTLGAFAMVMTQSRSGLAELVLLFAFYMYVNFVKRRVSGKKVLITFVAGTLAVGAFIIAVPFMISNSTMFQSYNTRFTKSLSSSQIDDGSSESRYQAALNCIRLIEQSPIVGHGTGFSRTLEDLPHNIYLQQWVNNGILGIMSYLALLITGFYLFYKRKFYPGQALILVTALAGLFSHNMLDQRPFLMLFGMLLTMTLFREEEAAQYPQDLGNSWQQQPWNRSREFDASPQR